LIGEAAEFKGSCVGSRKRVGKTAVRQIMTRQDRREEEWEEN